LTDFDTSIQQQKNSKFAKKIGAVLWDKLALDLEGAFKHATCELLVQVFGL
jgi:hypothetical protein